MVSKGHRKAGKMGEVFEKNIAGMLDDVGFIEISREEVEKSDLPKWYCRQYNKFCNIYDRIWKIDLLIFDDVYFPCSLAVELKYQGVGGSVDEKFPFVIQNLRRLFTEHDVKGALFLNGGAYRPEALKWCQAQQDGEIFVVEGQSDIYNWVEDNLR